MTSPSYTFEDAAPVKPVGGGRKSDPNPFIDIVAEIAGKTDDNGQPVAKSFVMKVPAYLPDEQTGAASEKLNPEVTKARRQLGAANPDPEKYRVSRPFEEITVAFGRKHTRITFWTTVKTSNDTVTDDNKDVESEGDNDAN